MLTVGDTFPTFKLTAVKGGPDGLEGPGKSFTEVTSASDAGLWKIVFFWPKDFTFICPTEIAAFGKLNTEFADRDCIVLGGSTDNEFCKLAWRREHNDLNKLNQWSFADTNGSLVDGLGVRDQINGVAYRATFIVDPHNVIQQVTVNNLNVGRNPKETLRLLDGLQSDELCACNRPMGGETIDASAEAAKLKKAA